MFLSFNKRGLGKTTMTTHFIDMGTATPVKQRFYIVSPKVQADLNFEIDRMQKLGVIEDCAESGWNNPATLVRKSNGKLTFLLRRPKDYRGHRDRHLSLILHRRNSMWVQGMRLLSRFPAGSCINSPFSFRIVCVF